MNYNSVSNQWLITIKDANEPKKGEKETFITLNSENTYNAMRDLKSTTFQLWFYLCDNMKGFKLWLSRADVINKTGISASSYARAVAELKEKGYLVFTSNNHYDFYAIPQCVSKTAPAPAEQITEDTTRPSAVEAPIPEPQPTPAPRTIPTPAPAPKKTPKIIPFTIRCLTDEEDDYKHTGIPQPRPRTKEHKSLSVDDINALLAEEC